MILLSSTNLVIFNINYQTEALQMFAIYVFKAKLNIMSLAKFRLRLHKYRKIISSEFYSLIVLSALNYMFKIAPFTL